VLCGRGGNAVHDVLYLSGADVVARAARGQQPFHHLQLLFGLVLLHCVLGWGNNK